MTGSTITSYLQEGCVLNKVHSRWVYGNKYDIKEASWETTSKKWFLKIFFLKDFDLETWVKSSASVSVYSSCQLELSLCCCCSAAASLHSATKEQRRQWAREDDPSSPPLSFAGKNNRLRGFWLQLTNKEIQNNTTHINVILYIWK